MKRKPHYVIRFDGNYCCDEDGTLCGAAKKHREPECTGGYRCAQHGMELDMFDLDLPIRCPQCIAWIIKHGKEGDR